MATPKTARTAPSTIVSVALTINREPVRADVGARVTLLDFMRERLSLTGTKKGCNRAVWPAWPAGRSKR